MKTCPECGSNNIRLFDSNNDQCVDCNNWFPAVANLESSARPAGYAVCQSVRHVKTGNVYMITETPNPLRLLEHCAEAYYAYVGIDGKVWLRRESEMVDGRFESA